MSHTSQSAIVSLNRGDVKNPFLVTTTGYLSIRRVLDDVLNALPFSKAAVQGFPSFCHFPNDTLWPKQVQGHL